MCFNLLAVGPCVHSSLCGPLATQHMHVRVSRQVPPIHGADMHGGTPATPRPTQQPHLKWTSSERTKPARHRESTALLLPPVVAPPTTLAPSSSPQAAARRSSSDAITAQALLPIPDGRPLLHRIQRRHPRRRSALGAAGESPVRLLAEETQCVGGGARPKMSTARESCLSACRPWRLLAPTG